MKQDLSGTYGDVKDPGEEEEDECVYEIDDRNGDVESIRLSVHVRMHNADTEKHDEFQHHQSDRLNGAMVLTKSDK
jgi:hypothetical protein